MALIAVAADKGAPGVTTACVALAAVWPRPVLLAECDPAGGDLACRLPGSGGGQLDPGRGLLSLAVAGRRGIGPDQILEHTQKLSGGLDVLAGVVTAEQGAGLELLWGPAGAALAQLRGLDVIADCGRSAPTARRTTCSRPPPRSCWSPGTRWPRWCGCGSGSPRSAPRSPAGTGSIPVAVVVVAGDRRFHAALGEVRQALGGVAGSGLAEGSGGPARVVGGLAYDPASAEALRGEWGGRLNRSLLMRTARDLAGRLAAPLGAPVAAPAGRR